MKHFKNGILIGLKKEPLFLEKSYLKISDNRYLLDCSDCINQSEYFSDISLSVQKFLIKIYIDSIRDYRYFEIMKRGGNPYYEADSFASVTEINLCDFKEAL